MDLAKNLKIESVSRLQPEPAIVLHPQAQVRDAVAKMQEHRQGCVLACVDQRLVGIFTERDLLKRVLARSKPLTTPLAECMTPNPVAVHAKEPVGQALRRMQEGGYRHLPVVDEAGHPLGTLPVKRILHYLVEHFPATVYNQPPDPSAVQKDRDGA
jgi:CBS domain-containing protein